MIAACCLVDYIDAEATAVVLVRLALAISSEELKSRVKSAVLTTRGRERHLALTEDANHDQRRKICSTYGIWLIAMSTLRAAASEEEVGDVRSNVHCHSSGSLLQKPYSTLLSTFLRS